MLNLWTCQSDSIILKRTQQAVLNALEIYQQFVTAFDLATLYCLQVVLVLQGCQAFLLDRADPEEKRYTVNK